MMNDFNSLIKECEKVLDRKTRLSISILDDKEKFRVLKYAILSMFQEKQSNFLMKISDLEKNGRDVFFVRNKLLRLPGRIEALDINFNEEHFKKTASLVNDIERELENV